MRYNWSRLLTQVFVALAALVLLSGCIGIFPQDAPAKIHLTVGGKRDVEGQILTRMYVLLLRNAGFDVTEKARLDGNKAVFDAITHGAIDIYPEFTTTGLSQLHVKTSGDPAQDYQVVKRSYEQKYHITWLNVSPQLNDTYGICTLKSNASRWNVSTLSQLALQADQLTIATSSDGLTDPAALPALEATYNMAFRNETVTDEEKTFQLVIDQQAQLNVCQTNSPLISQYNFTLLDDDKNTFSAYNPAPIVRDDTLKNAPQVASVLNQLAPRLTNEVSLMLQTQADAGFDITNVAQNWLVSQRLLPAQ